MVGTLRGLLAKASITLHYSGHSFHRGAGTWARQAGILDNNTQLPPSIGY